MPTKRKAADSLSETRVVDRKSKAVRVTKEAYSSAQKTAIAEFAGVTRADKSIAARVLKQHNWNVGTAVNFFFNNPSSSGNPLRAPLNKVFDRYRDNPRESPDDIDIEGCQKLLSDLQIEISDVAALVFFEIVGSETLGNITREGFVDGWTEVNVDATQKMRNIVLQRRSQLPTDPEILKAVYNHTFALALQDKQKSLPIEMAEEFWRVLLSAPALEWSSATTPWLEWWLEFYKEKVKKAVNKDLWKQTLNFALMTLKDDSLSFWSEESSWPSVIDEFVEWVQERRSTGEDPMETS